MHHYKQLLLDKNIIPGTDGKVETLKYFLSFDYKIMAKLGLDDEGVIGYITHNNETSHFFSWGKIMSIDEYTFSKLVERKYIPRLHYTINIQKLGNTF